MINGRLMIRTVSALACIIGLAGLQPQARAFETGSDMSEVAREEQLGTTYCDMSGKPIDAFQEAQNQHWSCCRLRIWVNPSEKDIFVNDLNNTIYMAKRVKQHGMKYILDIHYSDTWTDPGHQTTPAAWKSQSYSQLRATVQSYTQSIVSALNNNGALPDYVQIGNEEDDGILWPVGKASSNYAQYIGLVKAGVAGVKAVSSAPKIIIHIANGGNTGHVQQFFDTFRNQGVAYDIIGLSYYPANGTTMSDIRATMNLINGRYGKKIMIMEFSYPWEFGVTSGNGYWNTPAGQKQILWDLCQLMRGYSNGAGVMYWGAAYVWNPGLQFNWASKALWNGGAPNTTSLPAQSSLWAQ